MDIKTSNEAQATVITIVGRMDAVTSPEFEKVIKQQINGGACRFVVDFQGIDYISSAGLRALLATAKLLKGKGGSLLFANITGTVKEVFSISGFSTIFQTHDSVAAALAAIS